MEACLYAAFVIVWCVLVRGEPGCDQTEFLHTNGSCVACRVCGPGEQLSEDCGFGDGGGGVCVPCKDGTFSSDTDVEPCKRCTQCHLLNRLQETACSSSSDSVCGQCRTGYYELRSISGEVELPCVPCYNGNTIHKNCLLNSSKEDIAVTVSRGKFKVPPESRVKEKTFSMVLIGSTTASLIFLIALLLWAFLLTAERFKQVYKYRPRPEGLFCDLERSKEDGDKSPQQRRQTLTSAIDPPRCLNSFSQDNEVHPTSIVINVTTNIKPSADIKGESHIATEEPQSSCHSINEMEQNLQKILEIAQGQGLEMLDYDSVQDLSLLLDAANNRNTLRRLGCSLGVPPQVMAHLQGFQDLFQYLRTSTYTILPQLAQAAALLPNPEVVARIHQAVVNK